VKRVILGVAATAVAATAAVLIPQAAGATGGGSTSTTEIVINETGIIPLHFQVNTWAAREGISYVPRVDETTLAWKFKPKQH